MQTYEAVKSMFSGKYSELPLYVKQEIERIKRIRKESLSKFIDVIKDRILDEESKDNNSGSM